MGLKPSVEIPQFKLAKVGAQRERRGGMPWLPVSTPHNSALSLMGILSSKIGLITMIATIAAGAAGLGSSVAPEHARYMAQKRTRALASKPRYTGDLSRLPGARPGRGSLGMITGSPDGKTAEQRAREAAEARARAQAEADAAAKAEADAQAQVPAMPAIPDANALAAAAAAAGQQGGAQKGMGHKYGALSSSFGGSKSLAGGGGLSAGIGRGFAGVVKPNKAVALRAVDSSGGRAQARASTGGNSRARGIGARDQARSARRFSNIGAAASSGESGSSNASTAFDGGAGSSIGGAGAETGSSPADQAPDGATGQNQGGPTGGGGDGGGCDEGMHLDNGVCVLDENEGKAKDPAEKVITLLKKMVALAVALLAVEFAMNAVGMLGMMPLGSVLIPVIHAIAAGISALGTVLMFMEPTVGVTYVGLGVAIGVLGFVGAPRAASEKVVRQCLGDVMKNVKQHLSVGKYKLDTII